MSDLATAIAWRQIVLARLTAAQNELATAYEEAPTSIERVHIGKAIRAVGDARSTCEANIEAARRQALHRGAKR